MLETKLPSTRLRNWGDSRSAVVSAWIRGRRIAGNRSYAAPRGAPPHLRRGLQLVQLFLQPPDQPTEVRHLVAVGDYPVVHPAVVGHNRDVQSHAVGDDRDRVV